MKSFYASAIAVTLALIFCPPLAASGQSNKSLAVERCGGQVFKSNEVTRKARIRRKPEPGFTDEARAHGVHGIIRLTAVLCRSGRVTDIRVLLGLPHGMTERAVEAARGIRFEPARKDGRKASQSLTLEYEFILAGATDGRNAAADADLARHAGRLVEELVIEGNRRLTDTQLVAHLHTRPGDAYSETTLRRDLQTLFELGTLDKTQTRVSTGAGRRGGVVVIFHVVELPVIRSISFKGLKSVSVAEALAAIEGRRPGVRREGVYDPAHVEDARRALREMLAARGFKLATVEAHVESVSPVSVEIVFFVKEGPLVRKDDKSGRWF